MAKILKTTIKHQSTEEYKDETDPNSAYSGDRYIRHRLAKPI